VPPSSTRPACKHCLYHSVLPACLQDKVLSPQQVAAKEPLLAPPLLALTQWAAAALGRRQQAAPQVHLGSSLAALLGRGSAKPAEAQEALQQAAKLGAKYVIAVGAGQDAHVLVHRSAANVDLLQALVHAHMLLSKAPAEAAGGKVGGRKGGKGKAGKQGAAAGQRAHQLVVPDASSSTFVGSEYPQLLTRMSAAGWDVDRVSLVAPRWTLAW
jgi:hypothetical protein